MTVNPAAVGRTYPPTPPYRVGREKIAEFADAINDGTAAYRDADAARALGHPDVIAPPTFPTVLTNPALDLVVHDPEVGVDYSRVVHGEQRFVHTRPVRAGDVVQVAVTIQDVRAAAGNDIVVAAAEVRTTDGELVVTAYSTIVARGTAA